MSSIPTILKEIESHLGGGKCFNLLYTSERTADVAEFHEKCDWKGPTVTVLYGKRNTIFGGYTQVSWRSNKKDIKKDDTAFLFYKTSAHDETCVFLPIKKDHADRAITCDADYGPTFGGGPLMWQSYDLLTFKKKNSNEDCEKQEGYINLNGSMEIGYAYDDSQFKGQEDIYKKQLIVKRLEVYQVEDEKSQRPWRKKPTDRDIKSMMQRLITLDPLVSRGVKQYNILLVGMIGSGKSSLFNTLATVSGEQIKTHAPARDAPKSVTNQVIAYELKTKDENLLKLRIFDIRGFDDERGYGNELMKILDGTIQSGYTFSEQLPPDKDQAAMNGHEKSLDEQIHLVCFVTGTPHTDTLTRKTNENIELIKETINMKGLPMVVVATKFDELCPKISEDADFMYKSPKAQVAVKDISNFYGIRESHILPVVNYINDDKINSSKNRLALEALDCMIRLTEDYLENHLATQKKIGVWSQRAIKLQLLTDEVEVKKLREELPGLNEKKLRVLCVGSVCSGKSSFIDSLASTLLGKICYKAVEQYASGGTSGNPDSMTEKMYQMKYKNETGDIKPTNMYFGDIPGFQEDGGIRLQDVKYVIQGNVPNKYKIRDGIEKNNKKFRRQPQIEDKIHCVCFLFDISTPLDKLPVKLKETIQSMQEWIVKKNIPFVSILTKGDLLSDTVKISKMKVFENKMIKERMDTIKDMFNFKQKNVFPVINYIDDENVDPESDALLTAALREIFEIGKEYLEDQEAEDEDSAESDN